MDDLKQILDLAGSLTVAGLLLLILAALLKGWLVTAREYNEMRRQRDRQRQEAEQWKRLALRGTRIAGCAVRVAEKCPPAPPSALSSAPDSPEAKGDRINKR